MPVQTQAEYWNEVGGQRWLTNWRKTHAIVENLTRSLDQRAAVSLHESVLDVGCGTGETSRGLAAQVGPSGSVQGIDISSLLLDIASNDTANPANLSFTHADVADHRFEPNTYDLIYSRFGVMFFPDPDLAFSNLRAALKDSGRLVFMCWRAMAENLWMKVPGAAAFEIVAPPEPPGPNAPGPMALADPDRVRTILNKAGFIDVDIMPVDDNMAIGPVSEAVEYCMRMGPAGRALDGASEDEKIAVAEAMAQAFRDYDGPDGVKLTGAVWIVSAG